MSTNRKASMAKRQRELEQKDRVRDRAQRRAERKTRSEERVASGQVGAPIEALPLDDDGNPIVATEIIATDLDLGTPALGASAVEAD
jgi:hypothetical protein